MPTPRVPQEETPVLIEVLDQSHRVVAVLPAKEAVRQRLSHRTVNILLFDGMGRLHLRRNISPVSGKPERWDAPLRGPVHVGESLQDAATRLLETELGIHSERMRPILELPALPENNNELLHVFSLTRPEISSNGDMDRETGEYCFTPEELDCLLRDFRELVSPRFLLLAEALSLKGFWQRRP